MRQRIPHHATFLRMLPLPLELQRYDLVWKASHKQSHAPRAAATCFSRSCCQLTIVLAYATRWIDRESYVSDATTGFVALQQIAKQPGQQIKSLERVHMCLLLIA